MDDSEYHNIAQVEDEHWWYVGMNAIAADWLRSMAASLSPSSHTLDAGCGTGGGLKLLSEFGTPFGIDLHRLALRLAQEKGYTRLARSDVQRLPFPSRHFAILTSFDVLYHLQVEDDLAALREFARVLRPGGRLFLRLPAHDWLRGAHDRTVHTRHRYTVSEVREKLQRAGLGPVRVSYANALLFIPAALWRSFHRVASETRQTDVRLPPRTVNRALMALLRAEAALLRRFDLPFGLSVIAIAEKPHPAAPSPDVDPSASLRVCASGEGGRNP